MGYANHIGRVGALAVTLGVGFAIANAPAVAFADSSGSSSTTSSSSSESSASSESSTSNESSTSTNTSTTDEATSPAESDDTAASDPTDDAAEESDAEEEADAEEAEEEAEASEDDAALDSTSIDADDQPATDTRDSRASRVADAPRDVQSLVTEAVERFTRAQEKHSQPNITAEVDNSADDIAQTSTTTAPTTAAANPTATFTTLTTPEPAATVTPQPRPTLVNLVTETVAAVLAPLMGLDPGAPLQVPALWAMLAAARGEFEQGSSQQTPPAAQYTVTQIASPSAQANGTPYVLVIGVDGTNLGRILADPENDNFFALMADGTTAASSIVGHTTISNPSWSAILTGVWGETTGVVNNVFTPGTYNRWPTVFNLLESHDPNIETITIANWNVIADIAGAGSIPADQIVFVPQVPGDSSWFLTDDAVGAATVDAIRNTENGTPTFMFTYFVGVDENGHNYGGASPQYAEAIRNVDENIGAIMAEIEEREKCNPGLCENWTVIVVTDHGHQPQQGFGHGFQTPSETSTFVIARGSDFEDGYINLQYQIVDTTPTVLTLFGATPPGHSDGVSLTTLGDSDVDPVDLHQALFDAIDMNGYPDIATNVALSVRTIFTSIPYFIYEFTYDTIDQLKAIAGQDIFLVSALAGLAVVPVQLAGNLLYVATNIPAQIVARLTGVTGNSIFPLVPPPPSTWPPAQLNVPDMALLACGDATSAGAACNAAIVA
ncbi:MAG: alkaline phosphatase family protein [Actinomycetota bacterium]|nr:alkaline phosphatase family protein [Actinomycetota bacterium]